MKARAMQIASALEATLPEDFATAAACIEAALAPAAEHERLAEPHGAEAGLAQGATLGRLRVHEVEMGEAGRIFRGLAVQGDGVLAIGCTQAAGQQQTGRQQAGKSGHQAHRESSLIHQARSPRV